MGCRDNESAEIGGDVGIVSDRWRGIKEPTICFKELVDALLWLNENARVNDGMFMVRDGAQGATRLVNNFL